VDALAALRTSPATAAIFLDFDGTLAAIVPAAEDARPLPEVPALLLQLQRTTGVVAVVSGRPLSFLAAHLPPEVELHGLYGLEARVGGETTHRPGALAWRPVVDEVVASARAAFPPDVDVEHKGLSLTVHFRRQPEMAGAIHTWATEAAEGSGLALRSAKMSVELHPPVAVDKGTVVEERASGLATACYIGDDDGDLPAFAALDRLAGRGLVTLKVAVRTPENSPTLLGGADLEVDGPEGAVQLLQTLL
jgi:trehalose 6-phosphate phosphatase